VKIALLGRDCVITIVISGNSGNAVGMDKLLIATDWTLGFNENVVIMRSGIRLDCDLYGDTTFAAPCRNAITHGVPHDKQDAK
jgi:hypothetical protein